MIRRNVSLSNLPENDISTGNKFRIRRNRLNPTWTTCPIIISFLFKIAKKKKKQKTKPLILLRVGEALTLYYIQLFIHFPVHPTAKRTRLEIERKSKNYSITHSRCVFLHVDIGVWDCELRFWKEIFSSGRVKGGFESTRRREPAAEGESSGDGVVAQNGLPC